MKVDRTRTFLLGLPRVEETLQWDRLVYWVLDKAVGGKMFAMLNPEPGGAYVLGFPTLPERLPELLELEGLRPAPYLARAGWVVMERWDVLPERELHSLLREAYDRVESRLPRRVQRLLELNTREYKALVREQRAAPKRPQT